MHFGGPVWSDGQPGWIGRESQETLCYQHDFVIIIIVTPSEFFTPAFADGLSLESKWQQVSSCLQDSSEYSSRS